MAILGVDRKMKSNSFKSFKWAVSPSGHGLGSIYPVGLVYKAMARRMVPSQERVVDQKYEPFATEAFRRSIGLGDTVIDVGANTGYYTMLGAMLVGENGKVVSFEPGAKKYSDLLANVELNGKSHVILARNVAVSNKTGTSILHLSKLESFRSNKQSMEVQTIRLDDALSDTGPIGMVKIDAEGHEISVLEGAKKTLTRTTRLIVECWEEGLISAGHSIAIMLRILKDYGFTQVNIIDEWKRELIPASVGSIRSYSNKHKFSANLLCWK